MKEDSIGLPSGINGGAAGALACHPFDTVKCRIQAQGSGNIPVRYNNSWHCFVHTIKQEGVRGLYKGVQPAIVGQSTINGIVFGVERFTRYHLDTVFSGEILKEMIAGSNAGFAQSFVCAPSELVKLRTQHQKVGEYSAYPNNWKTLRGICTSRGVVGCFQGLNVTIFRDAPAFAVYFVSYALMMRTAARWKGIDEDKLKQNLLYPFVFGGMAGIVSWTVNYPVDVIKTRIQMDGADGANRIYTNSWDCFKKAWSEGGLRLLYRGLLPCYTRTFFNGAFCFTVVEITEHFIRSYKLVK